MHGVALIAIIVYMCLTSVGSVSAPCVMVLVIQGEPCLYLLPELSLVKNVISLLDIT